jgi:hypothetical protein
MDSSIPTAQPQSKAPHCQHQEGTFYSVTQPTATLQIQHHSPTKTTAQVPISKQEHHRFQR